jgi:hypothetical protein
MWEVAMADDKAPAATGADDRPEAAAPGKALSPEARRALAEAAERRRAVEARSAGRAPPKEHSGRGGLEPTRYDDWEVKGLASDF